MSMGCSEPPKARKRRSQLQWRVGCGTTKGITREHVKRTRQACLRCRAKKSKCNGEWPCWSCTADDWTCVYASNHRRNPKIWCAQWQEMIEEAVHRLFRACKEANNFPGRLPEGTESERSIESILKGMGFDVGVEVEQSYVNQEINAQVSGSDGFRSEDIDMGTMRPVTMPIFPEGSCAFSCVPRGALDPQGAGDAQFDALHGLRELEFQDFVDGSFLLDTAVPLASNFLPALNDVSSSDFYINPPGSLSVEFDNVLNTS